LVIHSPWSMLWRTMRASMVGSVADLFAFVVTVDYFPPPPRGTIDTRSIVSIHWVKACGALAKKRSADTRRDAELRRLMLNASCCHLWYI
jgi:hypothetical protein